MERADFASHRVLFSGPTGEAGHKGTQAVYVFKPCSDSEPALGWLCFCPPQSLWGTLSINHLSQEGYGED